MAKGDGVKWKNVKTASFTGELKKLHNSYAAAIEASNEAAIKLRDAVKKEWLAKHPDGEDGKVIALKVSNGSVQYAMVDAAKDDSGDDIFAKG
ncbi:hypothetical protein [Bradyrhizobium cenepequi]